MSRLEILELVLFQIIPMIVANIGGALAGTGDALEDRKKSAVGWALMGLAVGYGLCLVVVCAIKSYTP